MNPSTVGSMGIVVPGLEKVVVVFPATLDSAVVSRWRARFCVPCCAEVGHWTFTESCARNVLSRGEETFEHRVKPTWRRTSILAPWRNWGRSLVDGPLPVPESEGCMASAHKKDRSSMNGSTAKISLHSSRPKIFRVSISIPIDSYLLL